MRPWPSATKPSRKLAFMSALVRSGSLRHLYTSAHWRKERCRYNRSRTSFCRAHFLSPAPPERWTGYLANMKSLNCFNFIKWVCGVRVIANHPAWDIFAVLLDILVQAQPKLLRKGKEVESYLLHLEAKESGYISEVFETSFLYCEIWNPRLNLLGCNQYFFSDIFNKVSRKGGVSSGDATWHLHVMLLPIPWICFKAVFTFIMSILSSHF